ncbi:hypothetical protein L1049_011025 [Liquidambar formosana]|uniref:PGG domain-containing protein n=1 Tax=Liquidambar formosana TaxID=63359 RepID=A0AAP0X1M4_LIQFO
MASSSVEIEAVVETTASGSNNESMSWADSLNQDAAIGDAGPSNQTESITYMDPILHKAAEEGDIIVFAFIAGYIHLLLTPNKNTVLHIHITAQCEKKESTNFVEEILTMCPSLLRQANAKGETLLHIAARYGRSKTVKLLLERAKDLREEELEAGVGPTQQMVSLTNKEKDTALHDAVRFNHADVVEILIKEDRDFSYPANDADETPLYLAAERGFGDLVWQILGTCTSPAHGGPNGTTALHAAVINNDEGMTINILKVKPALTKEADQQGWTPLHYAAHFGYLQIVKTLLKNDMSSNDISAAYFADRDGNRTALHIAAAHGHWRIMNEIISSYPDCCELVDKRGWNVLHFVIESYDQTAIEVVSKNSSLTHLLNEKNNEGNTPLHLAAISGFQNYTLIRHRRVDKMAFNRKNLNALDISFATERWYGSIKGPFVWNLKRAGVRKGQRNITYQDSFRKKAMTLNFPDDDYFKRGQQTYLIVATLIATVTFAAGFTMPGGYITDKGQDQGTALLRRKVAFRAFVILDTIAMVLSSSAVFIHLFLPLIRRKVNLVIGMSIAIYLNTFATGAMVVAFMTGLYAVLENSSGLAIAICVIAGSFFFLYICLMHNCALRIGTIIRYHNREKRKNPLNKMPQLA